MAGPQELESRQIESKSTMLPLHHGPKKRGWRRQTLPAQTKPIRLKHLNTPIN